MKYSELLDKALSDYKTFSVVWRDDLDYNEGAFDFDNKIKRFLVDERRSHTWPGTELEEKIALIKTYNVTSESIEQLKVVDSPYEFISPFYPEDLFFSDEDGVRYGSCSHEKFEWFE